MTDLIVIHVRVAVVLRGDTALSCAPSKAGCSIMGVLEDHRPVLAT